MKIYISIQLIIYKYIYIYKHVYVKMPGLMYAQIRSDSQSQRRSEMDDVVWPELCFSSCRLGEMHPAPVLEIC